jgi:hypothetical protein
MSTFKCVLVYASLWLIVVGVATGMGYASGAENRYSRLAAGQQAISWAILVGGVAMLFLGGVFLITFVHLNRLGRDYALLWAAVLCSIVFFFPTIILENCGYFTSGDAGMAIAFGGTLMAAFAIVAFLIGAVLILFVPKKSMPRVS